MHNAFNLNMHTSVTVTDDVAKARRAAIAAGGLASVVANSLSLHSRADKATARSRVYKTIISEKW